MTQSTQGGTAVALPDTGTAAHNTVTVKLSEDIVDIPSFADWADRFLTDATPGAEVAGCVLSIDPAAGVANIGLYPTKVRGAPLFMIAGVPAGDGPGYYYQTGG